MQRAGIFLAHLSFVICAGVQAASVPGWTCSINRASLFKCHESDNCIPLDWVCNGFDNCPDGSDEEKCEEGGFRCRDSDRWIPADFVCNGYSNCNDSSDEEGCDCAEFTCSSGRCIDYEKTCNKVNDCGDWSDELNTCDCPSIEFTCESEDISFPDKCIAAEKVCDGVPDCLDGSDEALGRCNVICDEQLRCNTGVSNFEFSPCIDAEFVCDDYVDCVDGTDDIGPCPGCSERCISRWESYNGYLLKYVCIDQKICDGYVDCLDGSDETATRCDCSRGIECAFTGRCLLSASGCDGNNQCGNSRDWTDECFCDYGEYQVKNCSNTGRCLAPWQLCDGVDDCGDGSDEAICPPVVDGCEYLPDPKYGCNSISENGGRCIELALVCNGFGDCSDGSDETICHEPCLLGEIRCATGISILVGRPTCIPESMWCDGTAQCIDESDESILMCQDADNLVDVARESPNSIVSILGGVIGVIVIIVAIAYAVLVHRKPSNKQPADKHSENELDQPTDDNTTRDAQKSLKSVEL